MITSNIDELRLRFDLQQKKEIMSLSTEFLNSIYEAQKDLNSIKDDSLTYNNIKGITLEEIDTLFKNEETKQIAKNLRLTTLFTKDENLSKALFDVVLGMPLNQVSDYLYNRYEDKNIFLKSDKNSLSSLLLESINYRIGNPYIKGKEIIPKDRLNEILLEVNSFNFVDALSNSSKDLYDRYEDDNEYSFLYNDFVLKYEELKILYKKHNLKNQSAIEQFK